jgi:hypothetical protein
MVTGLTLSVARRRICSFAISKGLVAPDIMSDAGLSNRVGNGSISTGVISGTGRGGGGMRLMDLVGWSSGRT